MRITKKSRGHQVSDVQRRLLKLGYDLGITGPDGVLGHLTEKAVREFQKKHGLSESGCVDDLTWKKLVEESYDLGDRLLYLHYPFFRGRDVKELQKLLLSLGFNPGPLDGIFGPKTEKALKEFQKSAGLLSDGIVGPLTLSELERLGAQAEVEIEFPYREMKSPFPPGFCVVIDPGHGGKDSGAVSSKGLKESEIVYEIGERLGKLLQAHEVKVCFTRKRGEYKPLSRRASEANSLRANLFISIHLNGSSNSQAQGVETYYFQKGKSFSRKGKKLASLIHQELLKVLDQPDRGIKGRPFKVLRETRMPAVLLEPMFITYQGSDRLLTNSTVKQRIAGAIFEGIKKYARQLA